jgi:hypothetical protein
MGTEMIGECKLVDGVVNEGQASKNSSTIVSIKHAEARA